jgi:glycosyltransferase involved in cell wall biosynthesis
MTVSVAICTFNGAVHLREQLQSIRRQTRPPDEIVIGDDGSTDDTLKLVHAWASDESVARVRILPAQERLGVTRNFERTIAACTGDVVALCDQDDVWEVDRIERQVEALRHRATVSLTFSDALLVGSTGENLGRTMFQSIRFSRSEQAAIDAGGAFETLLKRNVVTGATTMIRRELFDLSAPFPPEWIHDEWLAIIGAATGDVGCTSEALIQYRQHAHNEIGAADPTLGNRMRRVMQPRGDRNAALAVKFDILRTRLEELDERVPDRLIRLSAAKAAFEARRASLPRARMSRAYEVVREASRGEYTKYASQGRLDIVRDLLQPA